MNELLIKSIEGLFENFKTDINKRFDALENEVSSIKSEVSSIKDELALVKTQVSENTQILKALKHSAEVNKAEHDKMANDIAHIKGDVEKLRRDINSVENITAKNWADITELKAIK
jgi:chromosome segregation ATPase